MPLWHARRRAGEWGDPKKILSPVGGSGGFKEGGGGVCVRRREQRCSRVVFTLLPSGVIAFWGGGGGEGGKGGGPLLLVLELLPPFPHFLLPPLPSRSEAAALACLCRGARDAARASRWHDAVRVSPSGRVREPAGRFDVEVSPGGESLQSAVDRCPPGGAILLRPGTHVGTVTISREVHVFGRGAAVLQVPPSGMGVSCIAPVSTLDGLLVRGPAAQLDPTGTAGTAVSIAGGAVRLQECDISSGAVLGVKVAGGADPLLMNCRCGALGCLHKLQCTTPPPSSLGCRHGRWLRDQATHSDEVCDPLRLCWARD